MSETADPDIYDVVPIPEGKTCEMWTGEQPSPCDGNAEVVFVYEGSLRDGVKKPKNALACSDCAPEHPNSDE